MPTTQWHPPSPLTLACTYFIALSLMLLILHLLKFSDAASSALGEPLFQDYLENGESTTMDDVLKVIEAATPEQAKAFVEAHIVHQAIPTVRGPWQACSALQPCST